ncbi:MAG: T9SS type A sorting domain-containing protein [Bacteroidota bacterium]
MKLTLQHAAFMALLLFASQFAMAQVYTQGDITVTLQPTYTRQDSLGCRTTTQMFYNIVIQNSFVGDSVKIKDMVFGTLIYQAQNSTGQSPWNITVPGAPLQFLNGWMVNGNVASYAANTSKVISGPDTIYNINNNFTFPDTILCQYGTVSGRVYIDYNSNCVFDSVDVPLNHISVRSFESLDPAFDGTSFIHRSDSSGAYDFNNIQQSGLIGYYIMMTEPTYQFIFPSDSCSPRQYYFTTLPQSNVDFALQCTGSLDVQCFSGSSPFARPLVPFILNPRVNNTGCNAASGNLYLALDPRVTYDSAQSNNPANSISGDTLIWNYTNLSNLSNGAYWNSFFAGVYLIPDSMVNIGDSLCFTIFTDVPTGDINPANNFSSVCIPVVNSFDPNVKEVSPKGEGVEGFIPATTSEFTYTIHFQNTGNAPAINVRVTDTLDADLLPESLKVIGADHSMSPKWLDTNVVQFIFSGINLPDSVSNEPASHGMVKFKVKMKPSLAPGTEIKNRAAIYFDSNPRILTNTALNTIETNTAVTQISNSKSAIRISPNPATTSITLQLQQTPSSSTTFQLFDIIGRMILQKPLTETTNRVELSGVSEGMYLYNVVSDKERLGAGKLLVD